MWILAAISVAALLALRRTDELKTPEMVRDFVLVVGWVITVLVATNQQVAAQEVVTS